MKEGKLIREEKRILNKIIHKNTIINSILSVKNRIKNYFVFCETPKKLFTFWIQKFRNVLIELTSNNNYIEQHSTIQFIFFIIIHNKNLLEKYFTMNFQILVSIIFLSP